MKDFSKYLTFPEYDSEKWSLKLELWLYLTWEGFNPVDWFWEHGYNWSVDDSEFPNEALLDAVTFTRNQGMLQ